MAASLEPTHAGGVVYRMAQGLPEFLVVTARRRADEWVYPKGHIEFGETPEEAATREVHEEAGVTAVVIGPLDDIRIRSAGEDQTIRYFLMRAIQDGSPGEGRRALWLPPAQALLRLSFSESRASLQKALTALRAQGLF